MFAKTKLEDKSILWLQNLMESHIAKNGLAVRGIMQNARSNGFTKVEIRQARHHLGLISTFDESLGEQIWRKSNA